MKKETLQLRKEAAKAIEDYRNKLLEDFLDAAKNLSKELDILCETGINRERKVSLKELEDTDYKVFSEKFIKTLKECVDMMIKEKSMKKYKELKETFYLSIDLYNSYGEFFCCFDELEVSELNAKAAQEAIMS